MPGPDPYVGFDLEAAGFTPAAVLSYTFAMLNQLLPLIVMVIVIGLALWVAGRLIALFVSARINAGLGITYRGDGAPMVGRQPWEVGKSVGGRGRVAQRSAGRRALAELEREIGWRRTMGPRRRRGRY